MSEYKYKIVGKYDKKYKFRSTFNGNTGFYIRTGILNEKGRGVYEDTCVDPFMASFPELIDIGIMERCVCSHKCNVDCYQKACDRTGNNMSLENFKWIVEQSKGKVFEFALGGAGDPDTHENFKEILELCAENYIVPNFTTSGICLNQESIDLCKKYCGAVAISEHYADYTDKAVEMLLKAGVKTNIHFVLNNKTIDYAIKILSGEVNYRPGINAIVFLLYKPVGLGKEELVLQPNDNRLITFFKALDNRKVKFKVGFDSCSCSGLVNYSKNFDKVSIDYCEGGRFSMYISADMKAMPCSFANQDSNWHYKLDKDNNITIKDAWDSELFDRFRSKLQTRCLGCKDRESCGGGCPLMDSICLCGREERTI